MTVVAVVGSELTSNSNNDHIFAASNKDTTLTRTCKNEAILTIVNVNIGSVIKNKVCTIFTIIDIELLFI